jgi:hypothetical protein
VIQHRGGETIGTLRRSTPTHLVVDTEDGRRYVARSEVVDIDHPGNVTALAGLALAAWGVLGLIHPAVFARFGFQLQLRL